MNPSNSDFFNPYDVFGVTPYRVFKSSQRLIIALLLFATLTRAVTGKV